MTAGTILWCGFVEENRLALHIALQGVTLRAADICVSACQRKLSALIVVKRRRRPTLVHVAVSALRDSILRGKLAAVHVRVTRITICRRSFELNFVIARGDFVTVRAADRAMGPCESKFGFGMIETPDVDPGARRVARFAAQRGSIGPLLRHAVLEFALVRIGVTGRAGAVIEMERQDLVRASGQARLVTFRAGDRHVRPGQNETRLLVLGDGEGRAMEVLYGVAILAAVLVGRGGELIVVRVLVTVGAGGKLHLVESVLAGRRVAFFAGDRRVFSFQRIL